MRNFASPSRYIRVRMPYLKMRNLFQELGNHPVLLCDSVIYDIVGKRFEEYLGQNGLTVLPVFFNGEASDNEINRVVIWQKKMAVIWSLDLVDERPSDSAKACADLLKITSCDCSNHRLYRCSRFRLSVGYTDEGAFERYIFYSKTQN